MPTTKGQLPKAYLRLDPNVDRSKVETLRDFIRLLCEANRQPRRGRFKSRRLLEALLGKTSTRRLLDAGDVVELASGECVVPGWDEWQEGDATVAERQRRIRARRADGVTVSRTQRDDVTALSRSMSRTDRIPEPLGYEALGSKAIEDPPPSPPPSRPDVAELLTGWRWPRVTGRQRTMLAELASYERSTEADETSGFEVVAVWIRECPSDHDPIEYAKAMGKRRRLEREAEAAKSDQAWQQAKQADRAGAPEQLGAILARTAEASGG